MTLVRDQENKKVVISNKRQGFRLPLISKSYTTSSDKTTNTYSENLNFTRLTSSFRYLLKRNGERKKPIITNHGRSSISRKKRNLFTGSMGLDHEIPGSPEGDNSEGVFPSVGKRICNMDYQKVAVNPPSYRSKPFIFR